MANSETGGGSLLNLGDLSKPATVLIEKIADAVGGITKPWQIVRVAKAEATADMVRVQVGITISEIERRAVQRLLHEEGKHQENIETITGKALPHLSDDSHPEALDDDWVTHFFSKCRTVSNAEMQSLWAKLLAGEANKPGSFSRSAVNIVAELDKNDADLFTRFCTFIWNVNGTPIPIVNYYRNTVVNKYGIDPLSLEYLDKSGLIKVFSEPQVTMSPRESTPISYYYNNIRVVVPDGKNAVTLGRCILTRAGSELVKICGAEPSEEYFMATLEEWVNNGYVVWSPLETGIEGPKL